MKNQHLPFEHLEHIRRWVESNRPLSNNAYADTEKEYRRVAKLIAELRSMSMSVPEDLENRARELEGMLCVPDEETQFMNHLANELIAVAKQLRSQYKKPGLKTKAPAKTLSVVLPDGQTICETKAVDTFVNVLRYMGLEKCAEVEEIEQYGHPVVSRQPNEIAKAARDVSGFFIETHSNTALKAEILKKYAERIGVPMEIHVK